ILVIPVVVPAAIPVVVAVPIIVAVPVAVPIIIVPVVGLAAPLVVALAAPLVVALTTPLFVALTVPLIALTLSLPIVVAAHAAPIRCRRVGGRERSAADAGGDHRRAGHPPEVPLPVHRQSLLRASQCRPFQAE